MNSWDPPGHVPGYHIPGTYVPIGYAVEQAQLRQPQPLTREQPQPLTDEERRARQAIAEKETAELEAWRQRVRRDIAGAEPIEQLLRTVGGLVAYLAVPQGPLGELDALLGSHAWTTAQVVDWFRRRMTGSWPIKVKVLDSHKTIFGRDKDRYSKTPAWFFGLHNDSSKFSQLIPAKNQLVIAKDGNVLDGPYVYRRGNLIRLRGERYRYPGKEFWMPLRNFQFSLHDLLLISRESGLQPIEARPAIPFRD